MIQIAKGGNPTKIIIFCTIQADNPDFVQASLTAKPPPKRIMTPQGSLVSIVFQLINEGEDSGILLKDWKGQNLQKNKCIFENF